MKLDIDCSIIKTMCSNYFVQEESFYLEKIKDTFEESRSKMSLGQEVVSGYIEFCQFREEFPQEFWKGVSRQFRYVQLGKLAAQVFTLNLISGKDISILSVRWML